MILKASNSSLLKPTLYENLATSRNALCKDLNGLNAEFPLLSIESEASKSSGLTYIIRPVRDVIIFFNLVSDIAYILLVIYYDPNTLVGRAVLASSNPIKLIALLAVADLTSNLSPGPTTIDVVLSMLLAELALAIII